MLLNLYKFSLFLEKLISYCGKISSWLAIPLIFIIIFDIITRRFFILGSTKLQEMEWHLHTALFLLLISYAYIKNAHVRIEIVREKYSSTLKSIFEILGIIFFLIPYTLLIVYYGLDFVERSFKMAEVSSALTGLSHRWVIKSFIPFGMFLLFIAGLSILIKNIVFLVSKHTQNNELTDKIYKVSPELSKSIKEK